MSEPEPYEDRLIGCECYNCPVGTHERGTATETHALEDLTLVIKDVPGIVCDTCGDALFASETVERTEELLAEARRFRAEVLICHFS